LEEEEALEAVEGLAVGSLLVFVVVVVVVLLPSPVVVVHMMAI
jgi:hypothetical protein